MKKAEKFVYCALCVLFGIVIFYLTVTAGISTSAISGDTKEHTMLLRDSMLKNLLFAAAFIAAGYGLSRIEAVRAFVRRINEDRDFCRRVRTVIFLLILAECLLFVFAAAVEPYADQKSVLEAAEQLGEKNFSAFAQGKYMEKYHNNWGLLLYEYYVGKIFGAYNYIIFQIVNALAVFFFYRNLAALSDDSGFEKIAGTLVAASGAVFLPLIFYSTFVYGNVPGLWLATAAARRLGRSLSGGKKNLALGTAEAFAAVCVRQNNLIFMVAIIIFIGYAAISKNNYKKGIKRAAIAIAAVLAAMLLSGKAVGAVVGAKTGADTSGGCQAISFVAMGLQEGDGYNYPGWINFYMDRSYTGAGCDVQAQRELCSENIKARLEEFAAHPLAAVSFFSRKNASQWNNPNFQSIWVNVVPNALNERPRWVNSLFSARGTFAFTEVFNAVMFIQLFGAVLFLILKVRRSPAAVLFMTVFLGGFIFHSFWEAKCQYTLFYYVFLIPLSVYGYAALFKRVTSGEGKIVPAARRVGAAAGVLLLTAAAAKLGFIAPVNAVFGYEDSTEEYMEYLKQFDYAVISDGDYKIMLLSDSSKKLAHGEVDENDPDGAELDVNAEGTVWKVGFSESRDDFAAIASDFMRIDVMGGKEFVGNEVHMYRSAQRFELKEADGGYAILFKGNLALTYSAEENNVILDEYTGSENQVWAFEKA